MARRVRGASRIRALLRGMPAAFREEMAQELDKGGKAIAALMQARAPTRTGALRAGISHKVWPKSGRMKVGMLSTKNGRSDLFYGRIQDRGRKAQIVKARRAGGTPYTMRVRAMAGKKFITGRFTELRQAIRQGLNGIFMRALARIGGRRD